MERENLKFSTMYSIANYETGHVFDFYIGKFFQKHWCYFKQIDIRNFENIGKQQADVARDENFRDIVILFSTIYQDWKDFLQRNQKSHYDGLYTEFREYQLSAESYLFQNSQEMLTNYPGLFTQTDLIEVLASTFSFEHPQVVEYWCQRGKRRTSLQRYYYNYIVKVEK